MRAPIRSNEEFAQVFNHCESMERPKMYRLLMLLSVKLGLRPMELAGLQTDWFRCDELRIPLGHSKRKAGRSLPVNSEILEALREHMGEARGTVFRNAYGDAFSAAGISNAMRRLYREAGVEGSCYSGRRSAAQRLQDNNANLLVIQAFLGHSSPLTTLHYLGVRPDQLREAVFG